jgi:L-lactate utilization protein LutC
MNPGRDAFLARVRQAVQAGNRPRSAALEPRGRTGYQGAGPNPVARFTAECSAAGGQVHVVAGAEAAVATVVDVLRTRGLRKALLGRGRYVDSLPLLEQLRGGGIDTVPIDMLAPARNQEPFFGAEVGITGVSYLIAETGTVVVEARSGDPRSLSLLPPLHIAVAHHSQLLPDLFDLFERFTPTEANAKNGPILSSCVTLITGPSKTGDIELRLVTGVHGPGEIHVVLVEK